MQGSTRRQIANTEGRREQPAKLPETVPCTHLAEVGVKTYTKIATPSDNGAHAGRHLVTSYILDIH